MPASDCLGKRAFPAMWIALVTLALVPGRVAAAERPPGEKPPLRKEWSLHLELDERYDDNILELSQRDLNRLQNPRPSDAAANRFSITTPDDFITMPRVAPGFQADWWRGRPTSFGLDVTAYQYLRNSIKNYQTYRLSIGQALRSGKALDTFVSVAFGLRPSYYVRNLVSDRHLEELGYLPVPIPRLEATYRRNYQQIEIQQEIVKDILSFHGVWGGEQRDYNRNFDERDSQMPYAEGSLWWTPYRDGRFRLRAGYRHESLHANGDLADTPSFTEDDISSIRDIWDAEIRFRWGAKEWRKTLGFDYESERRDYTTTNPFDAFHFGRQDARRYVTFAFRADLRKGWFVGVGLERESNRSTFPGAGTASVQPDDFTDYTQNLAQIGFGYDFGAVQTTPRRPRTPND